MKKLKNYDIDPMMNMCAIICAIYVQETLYMVIPVILFFIMGVRKRKP